MRKLAIVLAFFMIFGFVSVDVGSIFTDPTSVIEIGVQDAEARSSSRSRSSSRRSSPRRSKPRVSRPAPSKPAPRAAAPSKDTSTPKAKAATPGTATARTVTPSKTKTGSAAAASKRQASQYKASAAAKPSIRSSSGKTVKVAGTPAATSVRSMSSKRYSTLNTRRDTAYNSRAGMRTVEQRTVIVNRYGGGFYGDPYSGLFMYSLIGTPHYSSFHYNRWDSYSLQRQNALLAENASLKAEMAAMNGTPRNPNYVPPGTDADLMHSPEFVEAAFNPAPVPVEKSGLGFFGWFLLLTVTGSTGFGVWYIFFREVAPE